MSANTNILVVGIGGQGVMTAAEILAEAAFALGHDAKKTKVAGMAQRGGVVSPPLRFGAKVLSPQIIPGTAHVLLECVLQRFRRQGDKVVEQNRRAFEAGRSAVGAAQALTA